MASGLIVLIVVALLLAAAGLWLWDYSQHRQARMKARRHLEAALTPAPPPAAVNLGDLRFANAATLALPEASSAPDKPASPWARLPVPGWAEGALTPEHMYGGLAVIAAVFLLTWLLADLLRATGLALLLLLLGVFVTWLRVQRMRQAIVRLLPGFLDVLVRLVNVGNAIQSAFQTAVGTTKQPLRGHLEEALARVRAGHDLEDALLHTARKVQVTEMYLLSAIVGLSARYGGRSEALLERVGNFMRDREESEEELAAMTAETRLSAWVLGLLPVAVGGAILLTNGDYLARMWNDPTGRHLMYGAAGLELLGVLLLYRLAKLD
jgi:tight adherence protein B